MDEKTEELRDIFLEVSDEATVTEHQRDDRGSLDTDRDVEGELRQVLTEMRDRFTFETDLEDDHLVVLIRGFYDGDDDDTIAESLDVTPTTVARARLDLHLVSETDRDVPFDIQAAVTASADGASVSDLAERFSVDEATIRHHLRVHDVDRRSRQVNQRYRDAFDTILADAELSTRMVRDVHEDGLADATEGLETNVSF